MTTKLFRIHLLALTMAFASQCLAQPNIEGAEVSKDLAADFENLYKEWNTDKDRFQHVINQSEIEIDPLKKIELNRQFYVQKENLVQRQPAVTNAARAKWLLEPNISSNAYRWLRGFSSINATTYRELEAMVIVDTLLGHKELIPKTDLTAMYRRASICAFQMNEFDRARQYLDVLHGIEPLNLGLSKLRDAAVEYSTLWEIEQSRREEDSQTGNLPLLAIQTNSGIIAIELFAEDCPEAVAGFVELAENGFYDNHELFRAEDRSLAEWRVPAANITESKLNTLRKISQTGDRKQFRGSVIIVKSGENADCSNFAIALCALSQQYSSRLTIGRVVEGYEVIAAIRRQLTKEVTDSGRITKVQIVRRGEPGSSITE